MATRGYTPPKQCPVGAGLGLRQCQRYTRPDALMCAPHWRLIPKDLQRLVYATLRAWNRTGSDETWEAYKEARAAALSLVAPAADPEPHTGDADVS